MKAAIDELRGRSDARRGRRAPPGRRRRGARCAPARELLAADVAIRLALLEMDASTAAAWLSGRAPRERPICAAEVSAWLDVLSTELMILLDQADAVRAARFTAVAHRLAMLRNLHREVDASPALLRLDLREPSSRRAQVVKTLWAIADGLSRLVAMIEARP